MSFYKKYISWSLKPFVLLSCALWISACSLNNALSAKAKQHQDPVSAQEVFSIQLLGINDFHGQIPTRQDGAGMLPLAKHLLHAISTSSEHSFVLHAGDHVGASPAESALMQDEPAIDFLNLLNEYCSSLNSKACQIIGAAGNHEFDEGSDEMLRLLNGGNHYKGPFIHPTWEGANYVTLSANVVDANTQANLLPPYVVHKVNGVSIGFIGITLDTTPSVVIPGIVDNLVFMNQAEIVNRYSKVLQAKGVEAIVVLVHDGSGDEYYIGDTSMKSNIDMQSRFGRFVFELSDAVDVLVSGHSHRFTNAYAYNKNGKRFLVTQAFSSGRAYSDITVSIDPKSRDIVDASAQVIFTDTSTSLSLDAAASQTFKKIEKLQSDAKNYAMDLTQRVIGVYSPEADTIPLGQFIANAHQLALKTDIGTMNPGGVRASLESGEVTWGELFAIQPFGNNLIARKFTGAQLKSIIDERNFWSNSVEIDNHGRIFVNGSLLQDDKTYTVGGNNFMMNNPPFTVGLQIDIAGLDIDATVDYIRALPQPFSLN